VCNTSTTASGPNKAKTVPLLAHSKDEPYEETLKDVSTLVAPTVAGGRVLWWLDDGGRAETSAAQNALEEGPVQAG